MQHSWTEACNGKETCLMRVTFNYTAVMPNAIRLGGPMAHKQQNATLDALPILAICLMLYIVNKIFFIYAA